MVFWNTYPIINIFQTLYNKDKFKSHIFDKKEQKSPTGTEYVAIKTPCQELSEIRSFLRSYFGNPPKTPELDIPENKLLESGDHILYVCDSLNIVGCIRYHYIGKFNTNHDIYYVDCFCIHPEWRKKGIGDYLLTSLHIYFNKNNIPYNLFLKEGKILNIIHYPIYSGVYMYRKLYNETIKQTNIISLNTKQAFRIMDIIKELNPNLFIIRKESENQIWKLYEKGVNKILVCFQDTYQKIDNKKIAWCTTWIETPNIPENIRHKASMELSQILYPEFRYIWMNREWVDPNKWIVDGPFYFYSYQWSSSCKFNNSYCITI